MPKTLFTREHLSGLFGQCNVRITTAPAVKPRFVRCDKPTMREFYFSDRPQPDRRSRGWRLCSLGGHEYAWRTGLGWFKAV